MDMTGFSMPFSMDAIMAKIASIAPEFTPFPLLQELNNPALATPPAETQLANPYDWMNPATAIPGDPSKVQAGPLAGAQLPTPPAAVAGKPAAAPLSPQQMAALAAMQQKPQQDLRAPSAGVVSGGRQISLQPLTIPTGTRPAPGLAEILGLRR